MACISATTEEEQRRLLTRDVRNSLVRDLVTTMYAFALVPKRDLCTQVAKMLVRRYPFMKDQGMNVTGYVSQTYACGCRRSLSPLYHLLNKGTLMFCLYGNFVPPPLSCACISTCRSFQARTVQIAAKALCWSLLLLYCSMPLKHSFYSKLL